MPAVAAVLDEAGIACRGLARVVCGAGPGSFTSLRIAAAIAEGTRVGGGRRPRPLACVPSLAAHRGGAQRTGWRPGLCLARRGRTARGAVRGAAFEGGDAAAHRTRELQASACCRESGERMGAKRPGRT